MELIACPFSEADLEFWVVAHAKRVVIICPGGAYGWRSPREQEPVAKAFFDAGFSVAVLHYTVGYHLDTLPLREAGWAIQTVQNRTGNKNLTLLGFSAGAHVAASLAVHYKDQQLARPDSLVLCYPVISEGPYAHTESLRRLGSLQVKNYFSLDQWVDRSTPPTFLWHTAADPEVPVQNSLLFANALAREKVPFELHIYPFGVHGLSLATEEVEEKEKGRFCDKHVATWFALCLQWLEALQADVQAY